MTQTLNTVWYANFGDGSTTGYYAVTAWSSGATIAAGALRRQNTTPTVGNERVFVAIAGGTTGGSEPTWTVTKGAKNTDNTVTWQECTGQPGINADATNTPLSSGQRSSAITLGLIIKDNTSTNYFICSTAGTTGSGEPTYNTTAGNPTSDGTATWTCIGAVSGFTGKWGAPFARVASAIAANWAAINDTIYVSSIHAETQSTALTWNRGTASSLLEIVCVSQTGNIPPQSADLTTGASASTTGATAITLQGGLDIQGLAFNHASGANASGSAINSAASGFIRCRNCAHNLVGTSLSNGISIGIASNQGGRTEFINTTVKFSAIAGSSQYVTFFAGEFVWRDTPSALSTSNGWPTALFDHSTNLGTGPFAGTILFESVDLSAFAGTALFIGTSSGKQRVVLNRCKLPSVPVSATVASSSCPTIDVINCDSGGATYRHERWAGEATQTTDSAVLRTGGASDGTTPYAWKIVTNSVARWATPFEAMPIAVWNDTTGANVTVTLEAAYVGAALPNNDDLWLHVVYFGTAGSTLGSKASGSKADLLAANAALTASTAAWDSAVSARQNSHTYSVGDVIKLASNPGRVFVCTTAGTSAGSEPGGYATAVDGGSITDSGAVFLCMVRCKITVTLSAPQPQAAGYLDVYAKVGKASSTFYVDPKVTLS